MRRHIVVSFAFVCCAILLLACCGKQKECCPMDKNYLESWSENSKKQIVDYVTDVTNPESENFIAIEDRIATFDNDGTLWSEQPIPNQMYFVLDEIKRMAKDHPEWKEREPYRSALSNDIEALVHQGEEALVELLFTTHAGMSSEVFAEYVKNWLVTAKHPVKNKSYTELVYQPMLELLDYLRAHDFKIFIVSGGSVSFMRAWVEEVYGIPKDQVVGSYFEGEFDYNAGESRVIRKPKVGLLNDKGAKPVAIDRFIGRRPVFACGNSDGDLQMLQYADAGPYKTFKLYVNHTDGDREFLYDENTLAGTLKEGLKEAIEKGWCLIDMAEDWKVVYPCE